MADEHDRPLLEDELDPDPLVQLRQWLAEARDAGVELRGMILAARDDRSLWCCRPPARGSACQRPRPE